MFCVNIVALAVSFGVSLLCKLSRQSAVSVAIESSNQNAPLAIAIITLSLEDGYEKDLALTVPIVYMLMNGLFVILFGVTLRRTGWLVVDETDKTMTLAKIIRKWKDNRQRSKDASDTNHDQQEDNNGRTEMEMELKKETSDDGATNNYGSNDDEQLL